MKQETKKTMGIILVISVLITVIAGVLSAYNKKAKRVKGWLNHLRNVIDKFWNSELQIFENYDDASEWEKSTILMLQKEIEGGKWGDPADLEAAFAGHSEWSKNQQNFLTKLFI